MDIPHETNEVSGMDEEIYGELCTGVGQVKVRNAIPLKVTIEGEPREIAALVLEIQGRHTENALYDYDKGIKFVIPDKGDSARYSGGGGG